jgi:hypothetical protein
MQDGASDTQAGRGGKSSWEQAASLGFCRKYLVEYRELHQDHRAGLRPSCGKTAMQGKNKTLWKDMLVKETKLSANDSGLRMLFLRPLYKCLVEKNQGVCTL